MFNLPRPFARRFLAGSGAVTVALAAALLMPVPAQAAPVSTPTGPWIELPGSADYTAPKDFTGSSYPRTGISIVSDNGSTANLCTVSWPVLDDDDDFGFLTAGHCQAGRGSALWMYSAGSGERVDLPPLLGADESVDSDGVIHDSALFYLPGGGHSGLLDTSVFHGTSVRGVMGVEAIRKLPAGTPMCMNGSRSGITCGPLIRAGKSDIEWGGRAVKGDSGAPVFVVNARGESLAIGMLSSGPSDTRNFVTYLAPTLQRQNLRLVVSQA